MLGRQPDRPELYPIERAVDRWRRPRARACLEAQAKPAPRYVSIARLAMPGSPRSRSCMRSILAITTRSPASARRTTIGLVVIGPEAPLVAGLADDLEAARHQGVRPVAGRRQARRLEGLHQGSLRASRHSDRCLCPLRRCGGGQGLSGDGRTLPIVIKADGLAAGKGVIIAETKAEARPPSTPASVGAFGEAGAEVVIEEFLRGEEASFFALVDGDDSAAARHGAGPQARLRRRSRPQHRRHGRLLAGAGHDARALPPHDGGDHRADGARHG